MTQWPGQLAAACLLRDDKYIHFMLESVSAQAFCNQQACLCLYFPICGGNNIYPSHTGSERISELNPIWHFEHAKHNKNAKCVHDFIPPPFFISLKGTV